jgi:hypothetical protein
MKLSERAHLKETVVSFLEKKDWPIIQMILDDFAGDGPIFHDWENANSPKSEFIVYRLAKISEENLTDLYQYLGRPLKVSKSDLLKLWGKSKLRIFISHVSEEKIKANLLRNSLLKYGISSFIAHVDNKTK